MWEDMKAAVESDAVGGQFGYDCFEDEVGDAYSEAWDKLKEYTDDDSIYIECSIQCGRGRVDMSSDKVGHTDWDFESECDTLYDFAAEATSEDSFVDLIFNFLLSKYEDCSLSGDEDDDDDSWAVDDEYEGCEEEEDEDY